MSKKQTIKKIKLALLSCLILFSFITEKIVLIHADTTISIDVLFEQEFIDGSKYIVGAADQEFIYELTPTNPSNPMPTGSVGGVYESTLKGNVDSSLAITFDKEGSYEYILKSSNKNDLHGLTPASDMLYRIEVTVLKTMAGDLAVFVFAFDAEGKKVAEPPFIYTIDVTYNVKYAFQSGTLGMGDLPQAVKDMLPQTEGGKLDGETVTPSAYPPVGTTVLADGGVWTFIGWEQDSQTIDEEDVRFLGVWVFTKNPLPTITPTLTPELAEPTPTLGPGEPTVTPEATTTPRPTRKPLFPPREPNTTGKGGAARTGDTTKIYTLVALAITGAGVIFLAIAKRYRRDDD